MSKSSSRTTRSLRSVADGRIVIGKAGAPHGLKGELRVIPLTDFPERFGSLREVFIGERMFHVEHVHYHRQFVLLTLAECASREAVAKLTGELLRVAREDAAPLAEGEFYTFDIIGLAAVDMTGKKLGEVTNVLKTGSNDVYVVKKTDGAELLVPALKKVVREINIAEGFLRVDLQEELEDRED